MTPAPHPFRALFAARPPMLFPIAGAILGIAGAAIFGPVESRVGSGLAALVILALWSAASACRFESATQRVAPSVVVILLVIVRWQALLRLPTDPYFELAACLALARAAFVALAWLSRPAGDAILYAKHLTSTAAIVAIVQGVLLPFLTAPLLALALLTAAILLTWLLHAYCDSRFGALTLDHLYACAFFTETVLLVIAGCRNCFW